MRESKQIPRGYFSIGVENISKPMNLGNLIRSAHAFGANSVFTISPHKRVVENKDKINKSDTSKSVNHLPYYILIYFQELHSYPCSQLLFPFEQKLQCT